MRKRFDSAHSNSWSEQVELLKRPRMSRTTETAFGQVYGRFFLTPHLDITDDGEPDTSTLSELVETYGMWGDIIKQMKTTTKKLFTMFETSDVHPDIITAMKQFDQVVVPFPYLRDILTSHGVDAVSLGWWTNGLIRSKPPVLLKKKDPERLVFLYVGTNDIRKNVDTLTKVFSDMTHGTNHVLIVKTNTLDNIPVTKNIKVITDKISLTKMSALYNMCDYVISFTRGEGVGLPMLEADYFNKPIIAHDRGVFVDIKKYVNTEWITIPSDETPIDYSVVPTYLHQVFYGTWWDINIEGFKDILTNIFKHNYPYDSTK
mgnify:CR=1 FL=1